ncbi:MAG: class I SAM-dependent methyltransferase [Myxococcota bacterium]
MSNSTRVGAAVLDLLASLYPSPVAKRHAAMGKAPGDPGYGDAYARRQYMQKVRFGTPAGDALPPLFGKDVLEIGCGHGGITCYLASIGARSVMGIDINTDNVAYGKRLAEELAAARGTSLPVAFQEMDASQLDLPNESYDVVVAENVFEHFDDPGAVLREVHRVLRPDGVLVVPVFSSIISKHGLHLKNGLGLPWANLVFSEETIVAALARRARRFPRLYEVYPGLRENPRTVRDVRKYRDLNGITYGDFVALAAESGFDVRKFRVHHTAVGRVVKRLVPRLGDSRVGEALSTGAAALLTKRASS